MDSEGTSCQIAEPKSLKNRPRGESTTPEFEQLTSADTRNASTRPSVLSSDLKYLQVENHEK